MTPIDNNAAPPRPGEAGVTLESAAGLAGYVNGLGDAFEDTVLLIEFAPAPDAAGKEACP